ncbi:hypothetical protein BG015_005770, partial [Linnemannia schmuckeri]
MKTAIEKFSLSTTSGDERRFNNSSSDSIMLGQQFIPQTITITTTTATTTTTAIAPITPVSNFVLRLTTHQKTEADSDANQEEDEAEEEEEEEEEARSLEFLREDDEDDDALISTQSSSALVSSSPSHFDPPPQGSAGGTGHCAIGVPVEFQADESCGSEGEDANEGIKCVDEGLVSPDFDQGRIDGDEQETGGTAGGLAQAMGVVDTQNKDPAAQQDCIFNYPDPSASAR